MPESERKRIADAADVIANGYALLRHPLGVCVVNLDTGNVAVFSDRDEMLETSMPEIELEIASRYLKANRVYKDENEKVTIMGAGHDGRRRRCSG